MTQLRCIARSISDKNQVPEYTITCKHLTSKRQAVEFISCIALHSLIVLRDFYFIFEANTKYKITTVYKIDEQSDFSVYPAKAAWCVLQHYGHQPQDEHRSALNALLLPSHPLYSSHNPSSTTKQIHKTQVTENVETISLTVNLQAMNWRIVVYSAQVKSRPKDPMWGVVT